MSERFWGCAATGVLANTTSPDQIARNREEAHGSII